MDIAELLQRAQFVVDGDGKKKAVLLDYPAWQDLLTLLEDWEDSEEIQRLRQVKEESIPWEQAKGDLRADGVDV